MSRIPGINDLATTDPTLCEEWDYERNGAANPQHISRNALKSVWWHCNRGHTWKDSVVNRSVGKAGCKICEQEFHQSLPTLLIILFAGRNRFKLVQENESLIGIPIQAYIPELSLTIDVLSLKSKEVQRQCLVKAHLCEKRGVSYVVVPYHKEMSYEELLKGICSAFRRVHFIVEHDVETDIMLARKAWDRLIAREKLSKAEE